VDKGDGRVGQSGDGVVSISQIPGLVCSGVPVKIEEEVWLGSYLSMCYQGGMVGRESGDGLREACRDRVYLRGGADKSQAGKAALVAYKNR